jgi:hypothetical protein
MVTLGFWRSWSLITIYDRALHHLEILYSVLIDEEKALDEVPIKVTLI